MPLPDDPTLLREIIAKLLQQLTKAQVKALKLERELDLIRRGLWGRKSEKLDKNQLQMFADLLAKSVEPAAPPASVPVEPETTTKDRTKRRSGGGGGRTLIPDHLPRHAIRYELSSDERACPSCGAERKEIGSERSEQLEIVPAKLIVLEHVRVKYMCKACEGEYAIAPKPVSPIENCAAGPGLLAQIVVSKLDDHLPVYRQCEIMKRSGVEIPRATMGRWVLSVALVLTALYRLIVQRVKDSKVIHTDETMMPVLVPGQGQVHRGRMWTFLGDAVHPYVAYVYTRTKESKWPRDWLKGFRGFLQADAYPGFDQLYVPDAESGTRIVEVACWAHARRKFEQNKMNFPAQSLAAMGFIGKLYAIEARATRMSPRRRRKLRRKEARPILAAFRSWLDETAAKELPNSELGKAIAYVISNWTALTRYVDVGRLSIDNNAAERALRHVAVGRKNWMFAGHDEGAEALAILYTIIESAKRVGLNPETYLRDVLSCIGDLPMSRLEDLLPDRWKQMQVPSARLAVEAERRRQARQLIMR